MSDEVKKPEASEWWFSSDMTNRRFVVGRDSNGRISYQSASYSVESFRSDDDFTGWHHEPLCDSWTWQPEVFPQYWTARDSDSDNEVAFVTAEKDKSWRLHYKHGGEYLFTINRFSPIGRTQLTKEQAEALLAQAESPDDWVTQDVVPDRAGIDQWRRVFNGIADGPWETSQPLSLAYMHGDVSGCGGVFEVRCRRKYLPKFVEAKTRTVTLTLFLCWDREGEEQARWHVESPKVWLHCHDTGETKTIEVPL